MDTNEVIVPVDIWRELIAFTHPVYIEVIEPINITFINIAEPDWVISTDVTCKCVIKFHVGVVSVEDIHFLLTINSKGWLRTLNEYIAAISEQEILINFRVGTLLSSKDNVRFSATAISFGPPASTILDKQLRGVWVKMYKAIEVYFKEKGL